MRHSQWGPVPGCHLKVRCVSPRQLKWTPPLHAEATGEAVHPPRPSRMSRGHLGPISPAHREHGHHTSRSPALVPRPQALPQSQLPEAATRPLTPLDSSTTLRPPRHPRPRVQAQRFSRRERSLKPPQHCRFLDAQAASHRRGRFSPSTCIHIELPLSSVRVRAPQGSLVMGSAPPSAPPWRPGASRWVTSWHGRPKF